MKIGIFGGCFNPPHRMHKKISLELIKKNYVDKVIYVPTGDYYNKLNLTKFQDRYNMLSLMVSKYDDLSVSDISKNIDYQFTYQILDYFKRLYIDDDIYFICGLDNLVNFDTWMKYKYILENYHLLVIDRDNKDRKCLTKYHNYINKIIFPNLNNDYVSSTIVRKMVVDNKLDELNKLVDEQVMNYILKKKNI